MIEDIDIARYTNDNTPCIIADNIDSVIKSLEDLITGNEKVNII